MTTLQLRNTVELSVKECVDALICLADPDRTDLPALSMKAGFIDGVSDRSSHAQPGSDPRGYAAGYAFGVELVDNLRWTHEIQADTTQAG